MSLFDRQNKQDNICITNACFQLERAVIQRKMLEMQNMQRYNKPRKKLRLDYI